MENGDEGDLRFVVGAVKAFCYICAVFAALLAVGSIALWQLQWLLPDVFLTAFWLNEADKS